jgi:hypothetical protein
MSLTSYRAAPPRDKPLRAFLKTEPETNLANARGRRSVRSGGFLRRRPGQCPWVRGVCTNARPLWKGPRAIFSGFYGGRNGHSRAKLAHSSRSGQKVREGPASADEAGRDRAPAGRGIQGRAASPMRRSDNKRWGIGRDAGLNGRIGYQPRGKGLGRSSAVNAMVYPRPPQRL